MNPGDAPQARRCPPATGARASQSPPAAGAGYGLTEKLNDILRFVNAYQQLSGGISPSFDEIRAAFGLASKTRARDAVLLLIERGHLRRLVGRARAIEVIRPQPVPAPTLNGAPLQFVPLHAAINSRRPQRDPV